MENRSRPTQRDANPRTSAFRQIPAESYQQCFDILPGNAGACRLGEDRFERSSVFLPHSLIVSCYDTMSKGLTARENSVVLSFKCR